jgi:alcohol dehydrogenase, propanol-preferring
LSVGVQYAKAMGMRVIAVDGGDDKKKLCLDQLGAEKYIDFQQEKDIPAKVTEMTKVCHLYHIQQPFEWDRYSSDLQQYGAHGAIVYSAAASGYAAAPNVIRPGGTVVAVGLPTDTSVIAGAPPVQLALQRKQIVGSVTGTLKVCPGLI